MKPTHFRSAILILVVVMLIFSTECAGGAHGDGSEGQESSGSTSQTPVTSSPTASAAESELRGFFSVYGHAADEQNKYILIETRDDLVAVCGFAQSAPEREGYIKYRGNAAEPATLDAHIWLVPVEGRYAGEQIRIDVTMEELVSSAGQ